MRTAGPSVHSVLPVLGGGGVLGGGSGASPGGGPRGGGSGLRDGFAT